MAQGYPDRLFGSVSGGFHILLPLAFLAKAGTRDAERASVGVALPAGGDEEVSAIGAKSFPRETYTSESESSCLAGTSGVWRSSFVAL